MLQRAATVNVTFACHFLSALDNWTEWDPVAVLAETRIEKDAGSCHVVPATYMVTEFSHLSALSL